jgi:epoxyqueuosine reductase
MVPTTPRAARRVPASAEVVALGRRHGLDAVGVAPATVFATTRRHLEGRKAAGLHGGMRFTYLRPERSCDPAAALPGARALVVAARGYRRAAGSDGGTDAGTTGTSGTGDTGVTGDTDGTSRTGDAGDRGDAGHDAGADGAAGRRPASDGPSGGRAAAPVGRVARYAWDDHYGPLRDALGEVARALKAEGWRARVLADDNALVDREAAYRAGLGWYGKNANLLLPGQGSWFVLGSVVTDAPLTPTGRRVDDGCGTCTRCLDGCPTGAIVAPGVVDARRCLAWLLQVEGPFPREHRAALGDRLYGCDDCQEVCPPNRRRERRGAAAPAGEGAEPTVDLLDLLDAGDDELLDRHGRWYVPRRQARYLRRNALVVLGNVADPGDGRVVAALRRALADDDGLVRAHAVWAARRLGRDDLLGGAGDPGGSGLGGADDPDPLVRDELTAPVEPR